MKIDWKKLNRIGVAIGSILGYIAIITGIIMTIILLKTILFE